MEITAILTVDPMTLGLIQLLSEMGNRNISWA